MKISVPVLLAAMTLTAAGCGGRAHGTARGAGELAGVWTHTLVRAQLLATHAPDYPQNLKLDAGRYRLVLLHGRVKLSKQNAISTFHASGTFTVHGDTIVFRWRSAVENDAGSPPDHSCCDPPWRLRWSLYRGALTLREVPGSTFEIPPALWAASWGRLGT